jgi:ribosome biogenesis ATPase
MLRTITENISLEKDIDFDKLAKLTPGFVAADLTALLSEASHFATDRILTESKIDDGDVIETSDMIIDKTGDRGIAQQLRNALENNQIDVNSMDKAPVELSTPLATKVLAPLSPQILANATISMADFNNALQTIQPSSLREGFATVPDVTWADIGALTNVRQTLKESILWPIQYREKFASVGEKRHVFLLLLFLLCLFPLFTICITQSVVQLEYCFMDLQDVVKRYLPKRLQTNLV